MVKQRLHPEAPPSLRLLDPEPRPSPISWKDQRKTSALPGLLSHSDEKPGSLLQPQDPAQSSLPPPALISPNFPPCSLCFSRMGRLDVPQTHQARSSLRAFAQPASSAWNAPAPDTHVAGSSSFRSLLKRFLLREAFLGHSPLYLK